MASTKTSRSSVQTVTLQGKRYVILLEAEYRRLTQDDSGPHLPPADATGHYPALETMRALMARDLVASRKRLGLGQAALARRAGIRPETLNRLEQGQRAPSVATMQKIDRALKAAESANIG